jgi:hypothetical protein
LRDGIDVARKTARLAGDLSRQHLDGPPEAYLCGNQKITGSDSIESSTDQPQPSMIPN